MLDEPKPDRNRFLRGSQDDSAQNDHDDSPSVFNSYAKNLLASDDENEASVNYMKGPLLSSSEDDLAEPEATSEEPLTPSDSAAKEDDVELSEESPDPAFPIFLSFKANDEIENVSDGLREKSSKRDNHTSDADVITENTQSTSPASANHFTDDDLDAFDIPLGELATPIFKPLSAPVNPDDTEPVTDSSSQVVSQPEIPVSEDIQTESPSDSITYDIPVIDSAKSDVHAQVGDFPEFISEPAAIPSMPVFAAPQPSEPIAPAAPSSLHVEKETIVRAEDPIHEPNKKDREKAAPEPVQVREQHRPIFAPIDAADKNVTQSEIATNKETVAQQAKQEKATEVVNYAAKRAEESRIAAEKRAEMKKRAEEMKEQELRKKSTETPADNSSNAARPGTRYSAAQQMGRIAPLPPLENKKRKKSKASNHKPVVFFLVSAVILAAVFAVWISLDLSTVFFGGKESQSTTQTINNAISTTQAETENTAQTTNDTEASTEATTEESTEATTDAPTESTTEETTTETTAPTTTEITPNPIKANFSTSISGGASDGNTGTFNILFENRSDDVSLLDGIKSITITIDTTATVAAISSPDLVFEAVPDKVNTFTATPISTELIQNGTTKTVSITFSSESDKIGGFSVKYYVAYYE